MSGQIWVDSTYGVGSTFSFTMLLEKTTSTDEDALLDEEKETKSSEKPAEETKSQRLLVVEDNEFNMEVIKTMLQKMGHSVTVAWNGSECLEQLFDSDGRVIPGPRPKRLCFDLIFMDCNMPIMDGYEACT